MTPSPFGGASRRIGWKLAAGLVLLGAGVWFLLPSRPGSEKPASGSAHTTDAPVTRVRPSVLQGAPPGGSSEDARLTIQGTVLGPNGPLHGARVFASATVEGESLSTLRCGSISSLRLFECLRGEEADRLAELVKERRGEAIVHARTLTAEDGSFLLPGLEDGLYAVWAESPEGLAFRPTVAAGTSSVELRIGSGRKVWGTVTDDAKAPVPGALVTLVFAAHSRFYETLTDAEGNYHLDALPPGQFMAVVAKEGLLTKASPLWLYLPASERNFELQRPGRMSGRVLLANAPVAAATVHLTDPYGQKASTLTDGEGRFSFDGLGRQAYSLTAQHQGKGATTYLSLDENPQRLDVLLELKPAVFIEGVVRGEDQKPLAGAEVSAFLEDWGDFELVKDFEWKTTESTDDAGRYRLGPLPPGLYRLQATDTQHLTSEEEARPFSPGKETLDFILKRALLVEGVLEDSQGQPVQGETMTLRRLDEEHGWEMTSTGEDGRFSLPASQAGEYQLRVDGKQVHRLERPLTVPTDPLRIVAQRLMRIAGEVVDETGMPLPGVHVGIWAEQDASEEKPLAHDETNGEGRFLIHVDTAGRYTVTADLFSRSFVRTASQTVEVNETSEPQVRLRFEKGRPLTGRVVDWRGRPVPQVPVQVQPAPMPVIRRSGYLVQLSMKTDEDGRFSLEQISGEQFDACIHSDVFSLLTEVHGEARCARVKNDGQEVRLVIGRGVFVTGRLVHLDGSPVTHFRMNGREVRREDGEISLLIQQPGQERIELSAPGLQPVLRTAPDFPEGVQIQDLGTIVMSP
ncbi:MSCRAMM family protein [Hyalangium rubrum]|uniref:Carboxypeptidase-like regulatory domain-containing protein n=1 Tax=Hyalangium rubrum TaxID=3103134 RepID=A0ABU5HD63_9BACT|nr:carboxypeptidase-like regulatory domain-containing protein [Hyalangium sp. s54d21]MDY7231210.1 carboxypeptidase-like regulatory domain-containing protein [Hyalangium sp. s54d21]